MNFKVLLRKNEDNNATHEYINVIKDAAVLSCGARDIPTVYSAKEIKKDDCLIVITPQSVLFNGLLFRPKQKFLYWFQGVVPEEIAYLYGGLYSTVKSFLYGYAEKYILKKARLIFFVSDKLRHHYRTKYGYDKDNYIIMPCFNKKMDESCFIASRYEKPTFVYAGALVKWQCVEETIALFSKIKEMIPEATLTILTAEQAEARKALAEQGVTAEVKYVPLPDLLQELAQYKYGFLLRENMIINEVSTPTKINSYMAAGVIPIFTDVIGDFKRVFRSLQYVITCDHNDPDHIIERILAIEKQKIDPDQIAGEYRSVFDSYYNRDKYVRTIAEKLSGG